MAQQAKVLTVCRSGDARRERVSGFCHDFLDQRPRDPLQRDFHPPRPKRVRLPGIRPDIAIDEPARRRALCQRALEIGKAVATSFLDTKETPIRLDPSAMARGVRARIRPDVLPTVRRGVFLACHGVSNLRR